MRVRRASTEGAPDPVPDLLASPAPQAGAASVASRFDVTASNLTLDAKRMAMGQPMTLKFAPLPLAASGVECDADKLEQRIDWGLLRRPANASAR
eukprot:2618258-Prymnesium_polylepis.1